MSSDFNREGRNVPGLACAVAGAAALAGTGRDSGRSTTLLYRVSSQRIPAEMMDDTVESTMAVSAVGTHLGCTLSNWDALSKQFFLPCHALFDALNKGGDRSGANSRRLPILPLQAVDGKLVVAGKPSGHVGVKEVKP